MIGKSNIASKDYRLINEIERSFFEVFLKKKGLKLTQQRRLIFEEVFRIHGHVDAEKISMSLKKPGKHVSRASVYRTLDLLVEAGLVKPILITPRRRVYEHIHTGEHHDHLVCVKCGTVIEFLSPEIEDLQNKVCERNTFNASGHTMIIYGTCSKCRRKDR